ncbi:class-II fumarase/aspartase family protein [Chachezhania sediminis]|uniref:class-II fumarase/aspartase family protein n=1 Tax=Chachezhania sediminis TaxID=2599291 RepID=UPI00131AB88A|nr:adenylosuccinate lyase family protein [Chachezhania sediminis]
MAGSVFDSALFADLFPTGDVGPLFTDAAEVAGMLQAEGALSAAQGALDVIPPDSAAVLARAAETVTLDPAALARATGTNGVSVPALVSAFRAAVGDDDHAQYAHWGATSQDIIDTGLMLRLKMGLQVFEDDLKSILTRLSSLAEDHADTPMAARTYGQHATPTTFGAVVALWGMPLVGLLQELPALRSQCLLVSLSGAAGTASALGPKAAEIRAHMATSLGLADPGRSWHTDRTPVLKIADWLSRVTLALAKMGEDVVAHMQSGMGEVKLGGAGGSSTMPQKQNPVAASVLVALGHQQTALETALRAGAAVHRHQRDGAAWFTEWMCLPQLVLGAAASVRTGLKLADDLSPDPARMRAILDDTLDLLYAEALSFALAGILPRPAAQAAVKALSREALETSTPLKRLVARDWPDLDTDALFDPLAQAGTAPTEARAFVRAVSGLS